MIFFHIVDKFEIKNYIYLFSIHESHAVLGFYFLVRLYFGKYFLKIFLELKYIYDYLNK